MFFLSTILHELKLAIWDLQSNDILITTLLQRKIRLTPYKYHLPYIMVD